MEKIVIEMLGVAFRLFLRQWTKNSSVLSSNIIDVEQFAQECGLTLWEAKKFNRSIESFIDEMAEGFITQFGNQIENESRKKAIINQIQKDIEEVSIKGNKLISKIFSSEDLRNLIMTQSLNERNTWSDVEIGVYTNCVRYITKAGIDFISKLPSFTPETLKIIVERQDEYYQELRNILKDIQSMTSLIKSVEVTYREYESVYREKIIEKYGKVELIGSGLKDRNIRRYDISAAYVELNCISDDYDEEIELSKVFNYSNVVWIKGEAGSGKTTFLQWIAICAAKGKYNIIEKIRNTIPIVIGLRNIEWPINLQDIVNKITAPFGSNCPDGWILDLLKKKRALLLFDGLDEVAPTKREETYSFIEDILATYPKSKVLLTARNSINDRITNECSYFEIVPMKTENIKKFILYWHQSVLRRDAIIKDDEIEVLQYNLTQKIVESQPLKILARNPLLCAMICALNFINNEQLPEDKMELYEKCCEMLMDARDVQRKVDVNIFKDIPWLDYSRKRKILEEMAYWMMNGGISSESRSNVEKFLKHLLRDTNILLGKKRRYNVKELLSYFVERSGIIREPEEGNIDFIHKTFMEFLAVKAICRNCAWNVLIKEACNVNWKETIIMCFREMGKENVEYVLKKLVQEGNAKGDERYILIASLGASNAIFLAGNKMKEKIDIEIQEMIPPKQDRIYEIAQAGTYLLPFLKDSEKYSNNEKLRCLNLLRYLGTEEAIPDILSYISGNGNDNVKTVALDILRECRESAIDEYNVKEQLMKIMLDSIDKNTLYTYNVLLSIISDMRVPSKTRKVLEKVKCIGITFGATEGYLYNKVNFFTHLKKCEKVIITGNIVDLDILRQFPNISDLAIIASNDLSHAFVKFSEIENLNSVKHFCLKPKKLNFFSQNDLQNMKSIESFEFSCFDENLELIIDSLDDFPKLRKVIINVNLLLQQDIEEQKFMWKRSLEDVNIFYEWQD